MRIKIDKGFSINVKVRGHCKYCGECCKDTVYLTIPDLLNLEKHGLLDKVTMVHGLPALKKENGKCVFYNGRCKIYNFRPVVCRLYPITITPNNLKIQCTKHEYACKYNTELVYSIRYSDLIKLFYWFVRQAELMKQYGLIKIGDEL